MFGPAGSSLLNAGFFSSCGKQGLLSSCGVRASHCVASRCGAQASAVVAGGLSHCGVRA